MAVSRRRRRRMKCASRLVRGLHLSFLHRFLNARVSVLRGFMRGNNLLYSCVEETNAAFAWCSEGDGRRGLTQGMTEEAWAAI